MKELIEMQFGVQDEEIVSTGTDFDLEEEDFDDLINLLRQVRERISNCSVLIGGTPYLPNSRLLAYVVPAVEISHSIELTRIKLSSTAEGGAKWNYQGEENRVMAMTEVKLAIAKDGIERFFNLICDIDSNSQLPSEERITELWRMAYQHAPFLCRKYVEAASQFIHDDHNPASIRQYGVMHAIWAGELADSVPCPHATPINVTYGGEKEGAFNWVRQACLHVPLSELARIGFTQTSTPVRVIDGTYDLPVPYGEARAKLYGRSIGPIDVPLLGKEIVGSKILDFDESGPLDVPKPNKRISQKVLGDIVSLIKYLAEYNKISIEQATTAYIDFWRECKSKYGPKVRSFL